MKSSIMISEIRSLMKGGYDLHVHNKPSHFDSRQWDDAEVAKQYDECEFGGFLSKSHYDSSVARAQVANINSGAKTQIYGGVTLNWPVGGLNPYAVESCLKFGGKMVWMPTRDSANCLAYGNMHGNFFDRNPVEVTDKNGKLVKGVYDVFDVVKKYNGWLATGHISPKEAVLLCTEGRARGVNMILTHPDWNRTIVPLEQQKKLADMGVMVEKIWGNVIKGHITADDMAHSICTLGKEHVFLVTDLGQKNWPRPVDGMTDFLISLMERGISADMLRTMIYENSKMILREI